MNIITLDDRTVTNTSNYSGMIKLFYSVRVFS